MEHISYYIAKRLYADPENKKKVSLPAIRIAILGMAVGIAVMIVSIAIVIGFKHTIRDKVVGFGSHAIIRNFGSATDSENEPVSFSDKTYTDLKRCPGVTHIQRYATTQGILKTDEEFLGTIFKGVDEDWDSLFISKNLKYGSIPNFSSVKSSNNILISKIMADKLMIEAGNKIFAYFIDNNGVRTRRFTVSGIYETHLTKYDESTVFCDLYTVQKLNSWEKDDVSGVELTVSDFDRLDVTSDWLVSNINRKKDTKNRTYTSENIRETNAQTFSWLDLLDLNVWIILALMICVAGITMTSGLLIVILERVQVIGILKAMGARNKTMRHVFLWFGMFILSKGLILGNILGIGLCLLQQTTGLIRLDPEVYYVSEAPVELNIFILLALNICVIFLTILILVIPTFLVSRISPATSIKFGD